MDPQVAEDKPGKCPVCGMTLEPVRLDTVWSCPVHAAVTGGKPGRCPICRRDLVHVTMSVAWVCADHPAAPRLQPGRCADGSTAAIRYTPRPHGNHNPQHGGVFFMAPDNWHHLEGTYPGAGVFRVYLYDDYSRPLAIDHVGRVTGHVEIRNLSVPLTIAAGGTYLQSTLPASKLPVELTAKLRFQPEAPEYRFDFAFSSYSSDPVRSDARVTPNAANSDRTSAAAGGGAPADLAELHARADQIKAAIDRRAYAEIWVPALQAKDVALALDAQAATRPEPQRAAVSSAVKKIVQTAWMLDGYGDTGNAEQIADAYTRFSAAVAALDAALASGARP